MEKTNNIILNYLSFLNASSESFQNLGTIVENSDYLRELQNDYLQANWEILVESVICKPGKEFLEIYGEGADCNRNSSRVCFPKKMATHKIKVKPKYSIEILDRITEESIELQEYFFNSFVFYSDRDYSIKSPFNAVLIEHENEDKYAVVDVNNIFFEKIKKH
ncbi:MAG: hypothetical protein ABJP86_08940 [Flavobacteriaceae bacterium]